MRRIRCWLPTRHHAAGEWSAWFGSGSGPQHRTRYCPDCRTHLVQDD